MSRISDAIRSHSPALIPYVTAGYPDLAATAACVRAIAEAGAAVIEIGIPHSDPIADGPVIQASFTEALAAGLSNEKIFATVAQLSAEIDVPLVAMVSFSIVHRMGVENYVQLCKAAGFAGLIAPDLPLEEAPPIKEVVTAAGLDLIPLVAPTSPPDRQRKIAALATGFVYYLSVAGVTGERDTLPPELADNVAALKAAAPAPVCVGFGIHTPEQVAAVCQLADGAIVGSALIRRVSRRKSDPTDRIAEQVGAYCRQLLGR